MTEDEQKNEWDRYHKKCENAAFPIPHNGTPGMTLRDYFAAKAMAAILTTGMKIVKNGVEVISTNQGYHQCLSATAYMISDAMLAERNK